MRQSFTALGATQFARDMDALCALVEMSIPGGSAVFGNVMDGIRLLRLPAASSTDSDSDGTRGMTLKSATDRVFTDNAEAKAVLEELGMEGLTAANARHILQRRVENSE
jgi:RAD50-interacting protein 1